MLTKHTSFIMASLFSVGVAALASSNAFAANCQDFTIRLENAAQSIDIKATKFEYKDGSNWKTENLFGIVGYKRLDIANSKDFKRNLQGIGDEITQFRVTYKNQDYLPGGGYTWSDDIVETTLAFRCHDNGMRTVRLYGQSVEWQ